MGRQALWLGLAAGVAILASACSDLAGPRADGAAEHASAASPSPAPVGALLATPCAPVSTAALGGRDGEEMIVDVVFGRPWSEAAADGASPDELALVQAHGGEVLHRFRVPAVRVRMEVGRIPGLVADQAWVSVRAVPDPARLEPVVTVDFGRPVDEQALADFAALGGTVLEWHEGLPLLTGALPDAAIATLRARLGPASVTQERVYCPLG